MEKESFIFRRAKVDDILSVMKVIENRCLWMKENGINQWDEEYLKLYDFDYFKSKVEKIERTISCRKFSKNSWNICFARGR